MEVSGHRGSLGFREEATEPEGWVGCAVEGQGAAWEGKGRPCRLKEQEAQTLEEEAGHDQGLTPFSLSVMCWLLLSAQH